MKLYSKKHLLDKLEKEGLPHTYKSLLSWERDGIIPTGKKNGLDFGQQNVWRMYTEEEVKEIIQTIKTRSIKT